MTGCRRIIDIFGLVQPFYQQISLSAAEVGSCVLGCRLIINLREAYYQPFTSELEQSICTQVLCFAQGERDDEENEKCT